MIGPGIKTVFRTRWHALLWSASILLTAYCSVPAPEDAPAGDAAVVQPALQAAGHTAGQGSGPAARHGNPWAKTDASPAPADR